MADWIGYAAAVLSTLAFLPQVLRTIRTRKTQDISLGMYLLLCSGVGLWLVYGLMIGAMPIIAANTVTLILTCTILAMKRRHG